MVPLMGVRVGGTAVPVTARGAILHSGSALSLLTSKDFLYLGAVCSLVLALLELGFMQEFSACGYCAIQYKDLTFLLYDPGKVNLSNLCQWQEEGCFVQSVPGITLVRESGALEIVGGCSNISSLPNITFALGTGNFSLTPQQYIVQV